MLKTKEMDQIRGVQERQILISTGTRSTSTPAKSDETPREAPFGGYFDETPPSPTPEMVDKLLAAKARPGYPFDADTVAETVGASALGARLGVGKVSSPELASLAAKYVNVDTLELMDLDRTAAFELCLDVRRLAASVLSQAEGDPTK